MHRHSPRVTTIALEIKNADKLQALVADGHFSSLAHAANCILADTLGHRQAYRTGGRLTHEIPFSNEEIAGEEWRSVSFGNRYEVSNLGRVRSLRRKGPKLMKLAVINSGARQVKLSSGSVQKHLLVHRLVALAFLPNSESRSDVNHIDGNKANNRLSNLEWLSNADNQRHAVSMGIRRLGSAHHRSKLTEAEVVAMHHDARDRSMSFSDLAAQYGISVSQVRNIISRKNWGHLDIR